MSVPGDFLQCEFASGRCSQGSAAFRVIQPNSSRISVLKHLDTRVFIVVDYFDNHGGVGANLTALARGLKQVGHDVIVFSERPIPPQNQYAQALSQAGITLKWANPVWERLTKWLNPGAILMVMSLPFRLILTLADMPVKKRTFQRSWIGVRGRLNRYLPDTQLIDLMHLALYYRLTRSMLERRPNLVYVSRGATGLQWAHWVQVPSIYEEGSVPGPELGLDWWDRYGIKEKIHQASLVLTFCGESAQAVRNYLKYTGPIAVVPVMVEDVQDALDKAGNRKEPHRKWFIGTAGRLSYEKGHNWLLEAVAYLQKTKNYSVTLWIAGDGYYRSTLESLTDDLDIRRQIRFLGSLDAKGMIKFWNQIDIFVLPSLIEASPHVLIEAMALGKPIIATDVGGVRALLQDGACGRLVPGQNSHALAVAIMEMLSDPERMKRMAALGRLCFEQKHTPEKAFPRWLEAIECAINRRK